MMVGTPSPHESTNVVSEDSWEEFDDAATGRRCLICKKTQESFFTCASAAAAAGWKRYHDPAIGGNGHWWWHESTGRYFADPGRYHVYSLSPRDGDARALSPLTPSSGDDSCSTPAPQLQAPGLGGSIAAGADSISESTVDTCQTTASSSSPLAFTPNLSTVSSDIDVWISLDFEWTCDDGEDRQVHSNEGEIIEFAFVVFDVKLGRDVCEGQYYCKPQRTQVTEYCTDLTGISEETLKGAGSLGDALDAFEFELDRAGLTGRRCCAVTHGPCDLELTLPRNCGAIGRKVPSVLRSYVDLREAAQAYVRSKGILGARASTLRQICDALGVEMIGDEHCGLDDAWMVLLCFQVLLNSKMDLQIIDIDAERQKFLDSTCTERVLALDGLPWPAREIEIQSWLEGLLGYRLPANSVRIILGLDNRPSGRGMVDMGNRCNALAAFKVLACNAFSPGGCMMSMDDENFGALERLVLVRPLRRQERIELP